MSFNEGPNTSDRENTRMNETQFAIELLKRCPMYGMNGKYPPNFVINRTSYNSVDLGGQFTINAKPKRFELHLEHHPLYRNILSRLYPLSNNERKRLADKIFVTVIKNISVDYLVKLFSKQNPRIAKNAYQAEDSNDFKPGGNTEDLFIFTQLQCPNKFLEEGKETPTRSGQYTPFHFYTLVPSEIDVIEILETFPRWIFSLFKQMLEEQLAEINTDVSGKHFAISGGIALLPAEEIILIGSNYPNIQILQGKGYISGGKVIKISNQ